MKKTTLLLATFLLAASAFAQERKAYIGISLGPSVSLADFGSKDPNNEAAGYANYGLILDVNFAYKLTKNFGLTALLRGQDNNVDAQALAEDIANQNPGINWRVESDSWGIGGLMGGVFGSFPVTEKNKTFFEVRGLVGLLTASNPKMRIEGQGTGGSGWVERSSVDASGFSYMLGAGFRFGLSEKIGLLANADYLNSKPEFRNVRTSSSTGSSETSTYTQSMGTFNLGFGVAFRL